MSETPAFDPERYPGLSERQVTAIPVVLSAPTIRSGLAAAEVSSSTWYHWRQDEGFAGACRDFQQEIVSESLSDLARGMRYGFSKLLSLLQSKDERVALLAARELVSAGLKAVEAHDQAERLSALEAIVGAVVGTPGGASP